MTYPTAAVNTSNVDGTLDSPSSARGDVLDAFQKLNLLIAMLSGTEVALAVSGTVDIGGQVSSRIALTSGSGSVTSLGTNYGGPVFVRVAVACTLTYNATTLVTPKASNLVLLAGDWFFAIPKASGGAADGWMIIPAPWVGRLGLLGATPNTTEDTLTLGRTDSVNEGGQVTFTRSSDNARRYALDVFYNASTTEDVFRFIDLVAVAVRFAVDSSGRIGLGQTAGMTEMLDINSDAFRVRTSRTPASASASGNAGTIAWDSSYIYVCIATNTWRRVAHATW